MNQSNRLRTLALAICVLLLTTQARAALHDVVLANGDTLRDAALDSLRGEYLYVECERVDTAVAVDDVVFVTGHGSALRDAVTGGLIGAAMGTLGWFPSQMGHSGNKPELVVYVGGGALFAATIGWIAGTGEHHDLRVLLPEDRRDLLDSLCND